MKNLKAATEGLEAFLPEKLQEAAKAAEAADRHDDVSEALKQEKTLSDALTFAEETLTELKSAPDVQRCIKEDEQSWRLVADAREALETTKLAAQEVGKKALELVNDIESVSNTIELLDDAVVRIHKQTEGHLVKELLTDYLQDDHFDWSFKTRHEELLEQLSQKNIIIHKQDKKEFGTYPTRPTNEAKWDTEMQTAWRQKIFMASEDCKGDFDDLDNEVDAQNFMDVLNEARLRSRTCTTVSQRATNGWGLGCTTGLTAILHATRASQTALQMIGKTVVMRTTAKKVKVRVKQQSNGLVQLLLFKSVTQ
jgi:hypothetical protein